MMRRSLVQSIVHWSGQHQPAQPIHPSAWFTDCKLASEHIKHAKQTRDNAAVRSENKRILSRNGCLFCESPPFSARNLTNSDTQIRVSPVQPGCSVSCGSFIRRGALLMNMPPYTWQSVVGVVGTPVRRLRQSSGDCNLTKTSSQQTDKVQPGPARVRCVTECDWVGEIVTHFSGFIYMDMSLTCTCCTGREEWWPDGQWELVEQELASHNSADRSVRIMSQRWFIGWRNCSHGSCCCALIKPIEIN